MASDLDAEVERLVRLGATETGRHSTDGGFRWVVLADPDGNAFCVARPALTLTRLSPVTHTVDTVEHAEATPDHPQPYRELGLKDDEYQRIRDILGRRPTDAELAICSVMWSEHCSYKSSKVHLRYFGRPRPSRCAGACSPASVRTPAWSISATAGR